MKIKIIIFLLSICFASYGDNLKYITLPKDSQKFWQKENVSETTRKAWMKYEELLTRFTKVCSVIESEYDATGKSDLYGKHILELRKISSSPHWKNIATTQPFKVKEGVKHLNAMIDKYDAIRTEILNRRESQVVNNRPVAANAIIPIKKGISHIKPNNEPPSTFREEQYNQLEEMISPLIVSGANRMHNNSTRSGNYNPEEYARGKKEMRMGLKLHQLSAEPIRQEARNAGEDWAQ